MVEAGASAAISPREPTPVPHWQGEAPRGAPRPPVAQRWPPMPRGEGRGVIGAGEVH